MKEIFLGFVFDKNKESELLKVCKNGVSMAVNQYQLGFLEGLQKKTDIISALCIGAYPKKCKQLSFNREKSEFEYGNIEYLPFKNFYFIRERMFFNSAYKALRNRIDQDEEAVIYLYSLYLPYMKAVRKLKKTHKNIHCSIIITDLPGKYGFLSGSKSLQALKDKAEEKKKFKLSEVADSYVFLTEQMVNLFPRRPFTVIEGFLPQENFDYTQQREKKTILYTGSLNAAFGIENLLKAFEIIEDKDYRLWICGGGGIQSKIEEAAQNDSRITYFGFLPKNEVSKLQTRCDLLINPRQDKDNFTKYSFPSKTMEYLLSGSKVLMYRLSGIDEEYYNYIYTVEGETIEDLAKAICSACADETFYSLKSQNQVDWVSQNKSATKQIEKLKNNPTIQRPGESI